MRATRLDEARQQSEVRFGEPLALRQYPAGHEEVAVGKDQSEFTALGEEGVVVDEAEEVHLGVQRTGLAIRLESSFELKHSVSCERSSEQTSPGHTARGAWRS